MVDNLVSFKYIDFPCRSLAGPNKPKGEVEAVRGFVMRRTERKPATRYSLLFFRESTSPTSAHFLHRLHSPVEKISI